jgi:hypothetical protein
MCVQFPYEDTLARMPWYGVVLFSAFKNSVLCRRNDHAFIHLYITLETVNHNSGKRVIVKCQESLTRNMILFVLLLNLLYVPFFIFQCFFVFYTPSFIH